MATKKKKRGKDFKFLWEMQGFFLKITWPSEGCLGELMMDYRGL